LKSTNSKPHFDVTAALIWRDSKILITKRREGRHLAGYWEFPGGKQELGESLEECLRREISEELGVNVEIEEHIVRVDHDYDTKSISLHLFLCSGLVGEPRPIGCDDIRWVDPKDIDQYKLPPPDIQLLPLIRKLADRFST